jgi:hypothetical protein
MRFRVKGQGFCISFSRVIISERARLVYWKVGLRKISLMHYSSAKFAYAMCVGNSSLH